MPDDLLQRLDATAERLRRSKGWLISDAVRQAAEEQDALHAKLPDQKIDDTPQASAQVIPPGDVLRGGRGAHAGASLRHRSAARAGLDP